MNIIGNMYIEQHYRTGIECFYKKENVAFWLMISLYLGRLFSGHAVTIKLAQWSALSSCELHMV